jgi:hypothetical protein
MNGRSNRPFITLNFYFAGSQGLSRPDITRLSAG